MAHDVRIENNKYVVTYEKEENYIFWRDHKLKFSYSPDEDVYVFSSIFAPAELKKSISHRWKWYNETMDEWEMVEDIGYEITGGRDGGFRGYTYKNNVKPGQWEVDVITEEGLVLGVIDFEIVSDTASTTKKVVDRRF